MKYRTKPVEVEAVQFNKLGDHPGVMVVWRSPDGMLIGDAEEASVIYGEERDKHFTFAIEDAWGYRSVLPGDYIVTFPDGEVTAVYKEVFSDTYEPIPEPRSGLFQCSSCGTIGEWSSWLSGAFHGVHQCDCCYVAGKQHVLIPCKQD